MSASLNAKVIRQTLPFVQVPPPPDAPDRRRLQLAQGQLAQVHNGTDPIRYLAVIDLVEGTVRGNHYHRIKRESLYIVGGELTLHLEDLESRERALMDLRAGDLVFIPPGIAHALKVTRSGTALEFAPEPMDPADTFRHVLAS